MKKKNTLLNYGIFTFLSLIFITIAHAQAPCTTTAITSFMPASGPAGTVITINGNDFDLGSGTTSVKFNGVESAGFTMVSSTVIKAIVPASGTTGAISIVTNGCQATLAGFTMISSNCTTTPGVADVYISELYDQKTGSGGMIELYNPTGSPISFDGGNYILQRFGDISDTTPTVGYVLTLTGTIDSESTYLVSCTIPNQTICAAPPQDISFGSGFNGNDKFELLKNNIVIDRVNVPFTGPGFTLIRNPDAVAPTPNYTVTDWNNYQHDNTTPNTYCSDLGNHNADPLPATTGISVQPASLNICEASQGVFTVTANNVSGFAYQWKVLNSAGVWVNVANGDDYSGATTASLTITEPSLDFTGNQYYCQISSASCTLVSDAGQLTVSPLPLGILAITQPGCTTTTGSVVVTPSVGDGLTYSINGTTFQSSDTFTALAPGSYTLTLKTSANCTSTMPFVIDPAPTTPAAPTVTATQPVCSVISTGIITVTALVGTGITYSIDGAVYQTSPVFTNLPSGTYNVTVQNAAGCISPATTQIIDPVPPAPAAPTVAATQPTCAVATGSITVTAPTGAGLTYSIDGVTYQASTSFAGLNPGTYNVTVQSIAGCISAPTVQIINAVPNAPAAPTAVATQPTCAVATGTITVSAPTGAGLTYSIDGVTYQASASFASLAPGTYSITVKNADGCISPVTTQIINAIPVVPAAPTVIATQPTCAVATGTITVSAPTGTGITYSIDGVTYQASASFANLAPGTYSVTVTNADGCTSTATSQTINTVPNAPAAPTVVATQPTCAVATGTITVTAPTGTGVTYSIDGVTYQVSASFANLAPGTYSVTVTNADGCVSTATSQIINAVPNAPAAPTVTATQPTCTATTGTITVTAPTGTGITYSIDGVTYQASASFANIAPGTYSVTVTNADGCVSTATSQTINAVPAGPAAPTVTVTQPTCAVTTGTITITAPTGTGLTYSIDGIAYQTGATFNNLAAGTYSITVRNADGCTSAITAQTINAAPAAPATPTLTVVQPGCTTSTGTVTVTAPTGAGLTYSIDGTTYQVSASFSGLASGTYPVTVRNAAGCTSAAGSITINTPDTSLPQITGAQGCREVAFGRNYILEGLPLNSSFDVSTATFEWTANNETAILGDENTFNVTQYAVSNSLDSQDFPISFQLKVITPGGCEGIYVFTVDGIFCDIPKGISPNNDTLNDDFDITGLNAKKVTIFNRYGMQVYSRNNYTNQWHGQTDSNDDLPTGTYYYVIDLEGTSKTGWVYINRPVN